MEKNTRKSNFELLRILAMIMIILHHITIHCVNVQLGDKSLYALGEYFNKTVFFKRLLIPQLFMPAGKIGNIIFILIAGYFLIDKQVNVTKQIKKIFSQLVFVVPIVVLGSLLFYKFHSKTFIGIQNLNIFNNDYWFIGYYIGIIVIAKLFLNKYLNRLEKKEYITFLAIMFSIISIAFLRSIISEISSSILTLFVGVFIYSLGGYIRLYNPFEKIRIPILFFIIIISATGFIINNYNNTLINIIIAKNNNAPGMYQSLMGYTEYSIFCLLIGLSLFEIFRRINMKNVKAINYISSSTFMIYLLHDNDFIRNIWKETNWIEICSNNYSKFIGLYFIWLAAIFVIGILIYTFYTLFLKLLKHKFASRIIFKNTSKDLS